LTYCTSHQYVKAKSGETLSIYNPYDGSLVTSDVQVAGPEDVDDAVAAAKEAYSTGPWSRFTGAQRSACMNRFADLAEKNAERLAYLETIAMGRPIATLLGMDIPHLAQCYRCK
jgi:aldehyde dehydrogenase (NAD+)